MVVICAGCERPILDRFLLNVLDRAWHAACVRCCDCKNNLTEKCFSRDGKLFCRQDFFRRFGAKCGGCAQEISPNELVRRARSRVYHLKCFTCLVCRKQLSTGEELYLIDENRFICREDYLAKFQNGDLEDNDLDLDPSTFENTDDVFSDKDVSTHDDDDDDDDASRDSITGHPLVNNNNNNNNNGGIGSSNAGLSVGSNPNIGGPAGGPHSVVSSHFVVGGGPGAQLDGGLDAVVQGGAPMGLIGGGPGGGGGVGVAGGLGGLIKQEKLNNATDSNCSVDSLCSNDNNNPGTTGSNSGGPGTGTGGGGGHKESGGKDTGDGSANKDATDNPSAGKRRGPRTTIKAKQLETLKAAFAATPKPTRHIREQLAQETGLNMRVIQVWFQNRRSKERRMKQLSALGVRRQFYRNPRRLRALRPGEDLADELGPPGFNYFVENADFYPGYPGYGDYFAGHHPVPDPEAMSYLPPTSGHQSSSHLIDQVTGQSIHDGPFLPGDLGLRPNGSPEPPPPPIGSLHHDGHFGGPHGLPPHHPMAGLHGPFGRYPGLRAPPHADMPAEIW